MMKMDMSPPSEQVDLPEVRINTGITPNDVEQILTMAAASGVFNADLMLSAEDMAWDSAYGDGTEFHTFLKASITDASGRENLVGFLCYGPIDRWEGNFELYGIAVDPEYQRLGIGSALVAAMNRKIALANGSHVYLETGMEGVFEKAHLFYEANDFTRETRYVKRFVPSNGGLVYRYDFEQAHNDDQFQ